MPHACKVRLVTALAATGPGSVSLDAAANLARTVGLRWEPCLAGLAAGLLAVAVSRPAVRVAVLSPR